ncbi:Adenine phosphoribosyltransferase 1 [Capsicum annuum]|uniref:adenine phosphoribosyltransferase n=1 Tax=Capsicum annuum TaxID=4072 RepID=A0A2G2Y617_CAPAN|nr:Adenine phosphoribosyltransferase 1 [Capsicum annuum]
MIQRFSLFTKDIASIPQSEVFPLYVVFERPNDVTLCHVVFSYYYNQSCCRIESRGFIFGPPIALAIGAKFVPSRKPKKLRDELAALDGKCFSHVDQYAIVKLSIKSLQPILPKSVLAALKADSKAAHIWTNLANAYYLMSDHRSSAKCLEKAGKIKPNCLATRYAVGFHRIRDAERLQNPKSSSHGLVVRWSSPHLMYKLIAYFEL